MIPASTRRALILLRLCLVLLFPTLAAWSGAVAGRAGSTKLAMVCGVCTVLGCVVVLVSIRWFARGVKDMGQIWAQTLADPAPESPVPELHPVRVEALLEPLDDLRRATSAAAQMEGLPRAFVDGIAMVESKFLRALSAHGIEAIEPECDFDPRFHHAITTEAIAGLAPHKITHVYSRGYRSRQTGLLIRAAVVGVSAICFSVAAADAEENGALREEESGS